jgi:hypothetical protein
MRKYHLELKYKDEVLFEGFVDGYGVEKGYVHLHAIKEDGDLDFKAWPFVSPDMKISVNIPKELAQKKRKK